MVNMLDLLKSLNEKSKKPTFICYCTNQRTIVSAGELIYSEMEQDSSEKSRKKELSAFYIYIYKYIYIYTYIYL